MVRAPAVPEIGHLLKIANKHGGYLVDNGFYAQWVSTLQAHCGRPVGIQMKGTVT